MRCDGGGWLAFGQIQIGSEAEMQATEYRLALRAWSPQDWRMQAHYSLDLLIPAGPLGHGPALSLTRTFGLDRKQKTVRFGMDAVGALIEGLDKARHCRPVPSHVADTIPIGFVQERNFGNLSLGWESWWWQTDRALVIRQHHPYGGTSAIAVRAGYVDHFVHWITEPLSLLQRLRSDVEGPATP